MRLCAPIAHPDIHVSVFGESDLPELLAQWSRFTLMTIAGRSDWPTSLRESPIATGPSRSCSGCNVSWGLPAGNSFIHRPKGMHHRTFDRYLDRYEELDAECAVQMMSVFGLHKERW